MKDYSLILTDAGENVWQSAVPPDATAFLRNLRITSEAPARDRDTEILPSTSTGQQTSPGSDPAPEAARKARQRPSPFAAAVAATHSQRTPPPPVPQRVRPQPVYHTLPSSSQPLPDQSPTHHARSRRSTFWGKTKRQWKEEGADA
ncbi:hypothetical protein JB92DRAFT_3134127 [Gautieria morchelliformis]|nr:hypothetical protein JB92DRAFT_3134127 [Gautieria morchelliformis]